MKNDPLDHFYLTDFLDGIEALLSDKTKHSATVFCSPLKKVKYRVRITRRDDKSLIVTYGKPNYEEREHLKLCKKAKCLPRRMMFKFFKEKTTKKRSR